MIKLLEPADGASYFPAEMEPIINIDDPAGKTVGRRKPAADAFERGMQLQKAGAELLKAFELRGRPKGVFRFKTFEEAAEWEMKFLIHRRKS